MKYLSKIFQIIAVAALPLMGCSTHKQQITHKESIPYFTAVPFSPKVSPFHKNVPPLESRTNELAQNGTTFHSLLAGAVKGDSMKGVFEFLDQLSFKDDKGNEELQLHVASRDRDFLGDVSYFYIGDEANRNDKLYKYLYAKPSAEAAWQIYLLYTSSNVMPVYWHGGYERRNFIFDEAEINDIDGGYQDNRPLACLDLSRLSKGNLLLPEVKMSQKGRVADVYCTYWNNWKGLVRDHLQISFLKDGKVELTRGTPEILIAYDCGICY